MIPKQFDIQALKISGDQDAWRKNLWKHDFALVTSTLRHDDIFFYVMSLGTGWADFTTTTLWKPQDIKNLGKDNKFVIGLIKHEKLWELHLASNTGVKAQHVRMFDNWPDLKEHISNEWGQGYDITDMITADGSHCIVTSYGLNLKQSWLIDTGYPQAEIGAAAEKGEFVTDVIEVDGRYLWIFSGNTGYSRQKLIYWPSMDEMQAIRDRLLSDEGYDGYALSGIKRIDGRLLLIFWK